MERNWSDEEIHLLLKEVESRRKLWDAGSELYKMPKDSEWDSVADAINTSPNDCKGKWANLRITFNNNMEKYRKKKSGQGAEPVAITWKYFKAMMFLENNKVRQTTKSTTSMELVINYYYFFQNV